MSSPSVIVAQDLDKPGLVKGLRQERGLHAAAEERPERAKGDELQRQRD